MESGDPWTLRLPFGLVDEGFHFHRLLMDQFALSSRRARELYGAFDMSVPERTFVRELLRRKRNLWLFRCHQQRFCGDFIVVDMSGAEPGQRPITVIELKEREDVRPVTEGAHQLRQAPLAIAELSERGVVGEGAPVSTVVGGSGELLDWLTAD